MCQDPFKSEIAYIEYPLQSMFNTGYVHWDIILTDDI